MEQLQQQDKTNFHNDLLKVGMYSMEIPNTFFKSHRELLIQNLKAKANPPENSIIFMIGVPTIPIHDQDFDHWVDQEANFHYLFGVEEPDCLASIEVDTGKTTIFFKEIPKSMLMWMNIPSLEELQKKYGVEQVMYTDRIIDYVNSVKPSTIFLYDGVDSDSGLRPQLPDLRNFGSFNVDTTQLYDILDDQRVIKDEQELDILRLVTKVSSDAHINVMRNVKPGLQERQMESLFKFYMCERLGSKQKAYDCICASGEGNATLHYMTNLNVLGESELILNDMGAKYEGYCSDITCTFPSNGKFTEKQKEIYNAVYDANYSVQQQMGEGVKWEDMHLLAEYKILEHLQRLGLVVADVSVQELVNQRVGAVFMPCGLGHLIGLRVHDVGGYCKGQPERSTLAGLKCLRTRRTLKKNMVLTTEPGCYFNDYILEQAFKDENIAKYLVKEKIDEYRIVGGVRIEDDVIVLEKGCENMTDVPRTIEEIENCMAGKEWRTKQQQ